MIPSLYPTFYRWCQTGSIFIISDTHFDDNDCKIMDKNWITSEEHLQIIKQKVHKNDTLIHLGDVGDAHYIDQIKAYKVLITGNHDILSKVASHFDEVYTGPLFIADRILLSHEPIEDLEGIVLNIHGHNHNGPVRRYNEQYDCFTHINVASNVYQYQALNLKQNIDQGILHNIQNYHRRTIDKATTKRGK